MATTTATRTRRPATPADLRVGAHVYKGNGATLWRVWGVNAAGTRASLVKATTATDPTRGTWLHVEELTVDAEPEQAAPAEQAPARTCPACGRTLGGGTSPACVCGATQPAPLLATQARARHQAGLPQVEGVRLHRPTCKRAAVHTPVPAPQALPGLVAKAMAATCCKPKAEDVAAAVEEARARLAAEAAPAPAASEVDAVLAQLGAARPTPGTTAPAKAPARRAAAPCDAETQKCTGACGQTLPLVKFPTVKRAAGVGRGTECRGCRDARRAARRG